MTNRHSLNRRKFLQSSTAFVAAAPFLLPSRVWSAETNPSDRLVVGFIGMGTQGRGLMNGLLGRKEVQVVAVCDVDTSRREHARRMVDDYYAKRDDRAAFQGCTAHNDFRTLLDREDIEAVVIATPDHWHAPIGIAAAKAKKDIYCEKPLTQTIHEARALVKAVRSNKRIFQVGSMQRSSKEFRVACELVRNGRIGTIKEVRVAIGGPGKPCDLPAEQIEPGLDWDLWLGPAPLRPYHSELSPRGVHKHFPNWRLYQEYGGGMVTDWGAHHFDIAQWGLGMDDSGPIEVIPAEKENAQSGVRFIYANGVEMLHEDSGFGVTFIGTDGRVLVNRGKFEFWIGSTRKADSTKQLDDVVREYLTPADTKVRLYESNNHMGDWISCIRSRQRPICDVEIGARSVTVCHLCNLAYWHRERIKWNPKKEKFTGGTGNSKWLTREYRTPWKVS